MLYLSWIKREYQQRWAPLARTAPPDRPFINLAASGMPPGDAILAGYPDHLRLDAPPGTGWRDGADLMWGHAGLRQQLARLYSLPSSDHVLPVAGGSQALFLAFSALRQFGATLATIESPSYGPLFEIPRSLGFDVRPLVPRSPLPDQPFLHILSNPNNPTGAFLTPQEIRALLVTLPPWVRLLVDESFLSPADGHLSSATIRDPRIITISGLTKPLGLGALRIGWITAHGPDLDLLRDTWAQGFNIGSPLTESLAAAILRDVDQHHAPLAARAQTNLNLLTDRFLAPLRRRGLVMCPAPDRGCIAFPRIVPLATAPDPRAAADRFYEDLLDRHQVAVVPGHWFDPTQSNAFAGHVRLSFSGPPDLLETGLERLTQAIERLS